MSFHLQPENGGDLEVRQTSFGVVLEVEDHVGDAAILLLNERELRWLRSVCEQLLADEGGDVDV